MKKICLSILLTFVTCFSAISLSGCGNRQIVDFNYTFNKAYLYLGGEWQLYEIQSWKEYDDGMTIQVILVDGTVVYLPSLYCVLVNE